AAVAAGRVFGRCAAFRVPDRDGGRSIEVHRLAAPNGRGPLAVLLWEVQLRHICAARADSPTRSGMVDCMGGGRRSLDAARASRRLHRWKSRAVHDSCGSGVAPSGMSVPRVEGRVGAKRYGRGRNPPGSAILNFAISSPVPLSIQAREFVSSPARLVKFSDSTMSKASSNGSAFSPADLTLSA